MVMVARSRPGRSREPARPLGPWYAALFILVMIKRIRCHHSPGYHSLAGDMTAARIPPTHPSLAPFTARLFPTSSLLVDSFGFEVDSSLTGHIPYR